MTAGKITAPFLHSRVKPFGQALNESLRIGNLSRLLDSFHRNRGIAEGEIGADIPRKEKNILQDDPDMAPQRPKVPLPHLDAADFDGALLDIVETVQQLDRRGFA